MRGSSPAHGDGYIAVQPLFSRFLRSGPVLVWGVCRAKAAGASTQGNGRFQTFRSRRGRTGRSASLRSTRRPASLPNFPCAVEVVRCLSSLARLFGGDVVWRWRAVDISASGFDRLRAHSI